MPIDVKNDDLQSALAKLKAREETLIQLEELAGLGSWEIDLKTRKSIWSKQSYKIYGEDERVEPSLDLFFEHVAPEDKERMQKVVANAFHSKEPIFDTCRILKKDTNEIRYILLSSQTLFDEDGQPYKAIGTTQDITHQIKLKKEATELSDILKESSNEIYIIDQKDLNYLFVNQGACEALGYSYEEMMQKNVFNINPHLTAKTIKGLIGELTKNHKVMHRTIHRRKDGSQYHVQSYIHTSVYRGSDVFIIFDTDITRQVEDEQKLLEQARLLDYQANHDPLTSLPNRVLFKDRLMQTIASAQRNNEKFALFFIDLDQFKKINDSLGHHIGDNVLIEVAQRLQSAIREEDTLARLGGDEFTVIVKNIKTPKDTVTVAQKIINLLKEPIITEEHTLYTSTSIGISIFPDDTIDKDDLVKFADAAMYKAKEEGRDNYQFYSAEMTTYAFEHVVMENSLRVAIKEQQFVPFFQPQVCAKSGKIVGMEALVRWKHPHLGLVSPAKFIPLAEDNGLIIDIDRIMMEKAMQQFVQWKEKGMIDGRLALNLSMKQLAEKDFIAHLLQTMKELQFDPLWLELEVTESQVMHNPERAIEKLHTISDAGIEVAVDDFGTGYSSLSYLKKLPLDKLKIDQSFVRDLPEDEEDASIAQAIIALGKSLHLTIIAEGVETTAQEDFLREHGCDQIQGYLHSRPISADEMESLLFKTL